VHNAHAVHKCTCHRLRFQLTDQAFSEIILTAISNWTWFLIVFNKCSTEANRFTTLRQLKLIDDTCRLDYISINIHNRSQKSDIQKYGTHDSTYTD